MLSNLYLHERNLKWWRSGLPLGLRLSYYPAMTASFVGLALRRKRVRYLGHAFVFDNAATPMNLQVYPYEVGHQILRHVRPGDSIRSVLDVGGNLGQFAVTLKHFLPAAALDVIEPNTAVVPLLRRNVEGLEGVRVFNRALSPSPVGSMFYEPGRSCTGSLIRQNVGPRQGVVEMEVTSSDDIVKLTGRSDYDLVKIDVEGYEFEVLKCLAGLRPRYIFLELATQRTRSYLHSDIFELLRAMFGEFDILAQDGFDHRANTFDVMLGFVPAPSSLEEPTAIREAAAR
jgi:FkbM family methyltransferase